MCGSSRTWSEYDRRMETKAREAVQEKAEGANHALVVTSFLATSSK